MSEKEKPWYRDGETVLVMVLVFSVLVIWTNRYWERKHEELKPLAMVLNVGHLEESPTDEPVLHLKFYHIHPGSLENGRLTVVVDYPGAAKDERLRIYAFDTWEPNDDNAKIWKVTLPSYELDTRVPVHVRLEAKNARPLVYTQFWRGTDWIEDEFSMSE